jgi:hypothetical protein
VTEKRRNIACGNFHAGNGSKDSKWWFLLSEAFILSEEYMWSYSLSALNH